LNHYRVAIDGWRRAPLSASAARRVPLDVVVLLVPSALALYVFTLLLFSVLLLLLLPLFLELEDAFFELLARAFARSRARCCCCRLRRFTATRRDLGGFVGKPSIWCLIGSPMRLFPNRNAAVPESATVRLLIRFCIHLSAPASN
jgi:hypothetical protein